MELFLQLFITGILVGSIYAVVALGWTLIYKCSGVLNLAMGELTLIGAYVCLTFYQWAYPFHLGSPLHPGRWICPGTLDRASLPATHGGRTGIECHYGHRRAFLLFQRRRGVNLGNGYGRFHSYRLSNRTHLYRKDRRRPGLPLGFRRLHHPSSRLCLFLQIYQMGFVHAGNGG